MTKAEERKILEQIVDLIQSTPMDSYIRNAFSGVPEYALRNIEDDAAYNPVEERDMLEKRCYEKDCELQKMKADRDHWKHSFECADENYKDLSAVVARLRKECEEWEKNAHDAGDLYCELEEECRAKSQEITRLRAEIMRMKFERMTEVDLATMYEKMEGAK